MELCVVGVPLHICNDEEYGFLMIPLENQDTIDHDHQQLVNIKLEILAMGKRIYMTISHT